MSIQTCYKKWSLLIRLRRAVKRVRYLLNFGIDQWRIASLLRTSSDKRRFSFTDRPGLTSCTEDTDSEETGSSQGIQRTISRPFKEDVDKRAEIFIANSYRQLQMGKQFSMELMYCRANSFESTITSA